MIEGSGSGSIPLTSGSGSGSRRPKNMWIRWIRIRIRNAAAYMCADEPVEPAPGAGSAGACVHHQQVMAQHGRPTRPLPLRHRAPLSQSVNGVNSVPDP